MAVLAWLNVRQRLTEMALLKILGHSPGVMAGLILGKAFLWGIGGATAGCVAAACLAPPWVVSLFPITGGKFEIDTGLIGAACLIAPTLAVLAGSLAAAWGTVQDPALLLRDN